MGRMQFVGPPDLFLLGHAVMIVNRAFDGMCYQVGSSLERRDYRDVDVRLILSDEEYDRRFPAQRGGSVAGQLDPYWSLVCASISLYLKTRTGLPIDFQVQRMTQANEEYPGPRSALGLFPWSTYPDQP